MSDPRAHEGLVELRIGDRIRLQDRLGTVDYANDCRARVKLDGGGQVNIARWAPRVAVVGKKRSQEKENEMSKLARGGLAADNARMKQNSASGSAPPAPEPEKKRALGNGLVFGVYSATSVLRRLGSAGWEDPERARIALEREGVTASIISCKRRLKEGAAGIGKPADLTPEQLKVLGEAL